MSSEHTTPPEAETPIAPTEFQIRMARVGVKASHRLGREPEQRLKDLAAWPISAARDSSAARAADQQP